MSKDPAFLFYSNDFYEGTRMMLPEERACYIDLLIYQHQHGFVPNDFKRLVMYCSGCTIDTIQNVLEQKFNQTVNGWSNQKLNQMVNERSGARPKKIASATFAGLISSSKLNKKQTQKIKKSFRIVDFIEENGIVITNESIVKSRVKEWFNQMVDRMVNNLENENEDENRDNIRNSRKGGAGEKQNGLHDQLALAEVKKEISNAHQWKEGLVRSFIQIDPKFSLERLEEHLETFNEVICNDGETEKSLKDYKKHFNRWLMVEYKKQNQDNAKKPTGNHLERARKVVGEQYARSKQ